MKGVRAALADPHPLHLLELTSGLLEVAGRTTTDPFADFFPAGSVPVPVPLLAELVTSFVEVKRPETTALLRVLSHLVTDEIVRARIRRELAERHHGLPSWLDRLDQVRPTAAVEVSHVLNDGQNVMIDVSLPGGYAVTPVVYVDHNLGTVVKDAFLVRERLDETIAAMSGRLAEDPDMTTRTLDLADARVRVAAAIARGRAAYPPFETDTWPVCRPLVEWVIAKMPTGGADFDRHDWTEPELAQLADRFLSSPYAPDHGQPAWGNQSDFVLPLLWFGAHHGTGDPQHCSPVAVEIMLTSFLPDHVLADVADLRRYPELLRSYIRFCHAERRVPSSLTRQTLRAVDEYEPLYRELIGRPRASGPLVRTEDGRLERPHGMLPERPPYDMADAGRVMLARLVDEVGGPEALRAIDSVPLPDEPFDWAGVPEGACASVARIVTLCDDACAAVLDIEHRTACRRFLREVAVGDMQALTEASQPAQVAAAACWVVGQLNDSFRAGAGSARVKDLLAHLGLTGTVAQHGYALVRATGRPRPRGAYDLGIRSVELLVSRRRESIIKRRDTYLSMIAGD